jgi:hypothetical protein
MANEPRYIEQYARVRRWYERFKAIAGGQEHRMPSAYYRDDVVAFFINCHHLKDWVKNDPFALEHGSLTRTGVEDFVNASAELRICGDVCNGSKHFLLDPNRSSTQDASTSIAKTAHSLYLGAYTPVYAAYFEVVSSGKSRDAFELATSCLAQWDQYLQEHSLLPSEETLKVLGV